MINKEGNLKRRKTNQKEKQDFFYAHLFLTKKSLDDFEVFSTAQDRWLEISSVSNFKSFQAERLQLRYRNKEGAKQSVHTLNGSSLALPRVLAGLLENCQGPDGIRIPKALVPYCGFENIES